MQRSVKAFIYRGENHYIAECFPISVVTQGETLDETVENLKQAVALFLQDEDPAEYGLEPQPSLLINLEVEPLRLVG